MKLKKYASQGKSNHYCTKKPQTHWTPEIYSYLEFYCSILESHVNLLHTWIRAMNSKFNTILNEKLCFGGDTCVKKNGAYPEKPLLGENTEVEGELKKNLAEPVLIPKIQPQSIVFRSLNLDFV